MRDTDAVLVVDHDARGCEALASALARAGYAVETAGQVFLTRTQSWQPAAVVAELWMPDAHGTELVRALRQRGATTPVVFLARGETRDMCTCAEAYGAEACLPRPVVMDDLIWTIERAVARRESLALPRRRRPISEPAAGRRWAAAPSGLAFAR